MPKRKCSEVDLYLGSNLSYYRKLAGLTQQQVADMLNLNRTTYTKYETGVSEPSIEILKRIAETFGVEVGDLLDEAPDQINSEVFDSDFENDSLKNELRVLCKDYSLLSREDREEVKRLIEHLKNKK